MAAFGWALVILAQLFLALKLYIAYDTEGGRARKAALLDGAFLPPFLGVVGLHVVHRGTGMAWPGTAYLALWTVQTIFCFTAIVLAGKYKEYRRKRRPSRH